MNYLFWLRNIGAASGEKQEEFVLGTPMGMGTLVALLGGAAVIILLLYWRDMRTKRARRRAVLWGLRFLGLACIGLLLLEPTMAWKRTHPEEASVVVLLDASASMVLKDKLSDPETRFALAQRHDLLTDDQLQDAESGKPKAGILTAQQNKEVDELTRMTVVRDALGQGGDVFLQKARERFKTRLLRFGSKVEELSADALKGKSPLAMNIVMGEDAGGGLTDISLALKEIEKLSASEKVAGVILITDGNWNSGSDPLIAANRLGERGIPVFCVGVGNPDEVKDIEVADLKVKRSVYLKDTVAVAAEVRWSGYDEKQVTVVLRQGEDVLQEKKIDLTKGATSQTVGLQFVPEKVGVIVGTVAIEPEVDEIRSDNNLRTFEIEVTRSKKKVLMVEKFPRWEWRFLKNAVYRDPDFDLTCLLFNGMGRPSEGEMFITSFPSTRKELYEFEVLIFGDVPASEFSPRQLELVSTYVEERGSPLIVISGEMYMPSSYGGTVIEALLPVLLDTSPKGRTGVNFDSGFNLELTAEGWDSPILQLSDTPQENDRLWMDMAPSYWCASVERAKAGATVLAVHPFLSNRYGKLPLLATQRYGNGNTLILNIDSTWKWRLGHGDIVHYRFWGNVLRWAIATPLEGKGKYVTLSSDKEEYVLGEAATVYAKVVDKEYLPFSGGDVLLEITDPFGRNERLAMELTDAKKGLYQAKHTIQSSGMYRVQSAVPSLGEEGVQAAIKIEGKSVSVERNSLRMERDTLEQIAQETGGRFHMIDTAGNIPEEIPFSRRELTERGRRSLWDSHYAILAFLGIMTLEWVLRKKKGYV